MEELETIEQIPQVELEGVAEQTKVAYRINVSTEMVEKVLEKHLEKQIKSIKYQNDIILTSLFTSTSIVLVLAGLLLNAHIYLWFGLIILFASFIHISGFNERYKNRIKSERT
ncbi:hypothetical protein HYW99_04005 [Candidatus Woesearchaeota archaeon]|nr:hypothetical protein [Candidatus Aenigmarchaeota archaeon]MBI2647616.1 hypothetical protein [Candidatus Woesearchaeota archaeon]